MQLILNKYGASIQVKNGMFSVGIDKEYSSIPVTKVSSILINKSIQLSSNVLFLAIENEIEVILIDKIGKPQGRIWSPKYGSISNIRKNQVEFTKTAAAVLWIKELLEAKILNQQSLLYSLVKYDFSNMDLIEKAVRKLESILVKIRSAEGARIEEIAKQIRGYEGSASRVYFETLNVHLPEMYQFERRSQHPALDMFNALLNYGYGMLYNHVERTLIMAGIDPYLGVFHRDTHNRPVLVYDVIELYRVWVDFVVVDLCMQHVIFPDFFDVENGKWLLNEHSKRILISAFNDYMDEVIDQNGVSRSRSNHIQQYAQHFATRLKKLKIRTEKLKK